MKRIFPLLLALAAAVLMCSPSNLSAQTLAGNHTISLSGCGTANNPDVIGVGAQCVVNAEPIEPTGEYSWMFTQLNLVPEGAPQVEPTAGWGYLSFANGLAGLDYVQIDASPGAVRCVTWATITVKGFTSRQCTFLAIYFHGAYRSDPKQQYFGEATIHFAYDVQVTRYNHAWERNAVTGNIRVYDVTSALVSNARYYPMCQLFINVGVRFYNGLPWWGLVYSQDCGDGLQEIYFVPYLPY